jgi:3-isopropylmalate/(R)-2-methylmalate dehydratase large subunit
MGFTITEKILARTAGLPFVNAGDEIMAKPDFVLAYDFPGYTDVIFKQLKNDFGITKMAEPERFGIFIDHMVPAITPAEEELHKGTREWTAINDVKLYERKGIGHQVSSEVGYATPGAFAVHFDGHVSQLGTFGTLAMGLRRNVLEAFAMDRVSLRVPQTTRVDLVGKLQPGVMARDVFHHIVRVLGPASCRFQVLEIGGPAVADMSNDALQTITGLAMFTGAVTAIVNPDAKRLAYALPRAKKQLEPVSSDDDATYAARHTIDLSTLEPIIVIPPSPANTRDLKDYLGLSVQTGYLGSCASGRIEDMRAAAEVLRGRQVAEGFQLHVVPTSQEIMVAAAKEGLIAVLAEAGAFVSSPSCDYCFGRIATMAPGQRAVSTGTLNVRGRMGSPDSEIYLCNAAVIAASAIEGKIADPRPYLQGQGAARP